MWDVGFYCFKSPSLSILFCTSSFIRFSVDRSYSSMLYGWLVCMGKESSCHRPEKCCTDRREMWTSYILTNTRLCLIGCAQVCLSVQRDSQRAVANRLSPMKGNKRVKTFYTTPKV